MLTKREIFKTCICDYSATNRMKRYQNVQTSKSLWTKPKKQQPLESNNKKNMRARFVFNMYTQSIHRRVVRANEIV